MEQTQNAIVPLADTFFLAPVVEVHAALVRHQAMKDFVEGALHVNIDFGKIPGTDKNTLLKPGAEKLANFFGLAPTFEIVEKELDWTGEHHADEAFFYFHYRCRLMRGDRLAAEGEGSASSFEKKYRWRLSEIVCPECGKPAIKKSKYPPRDNPRAQPGWYCHDKAGGCGANFAVDDKRITEQPRGQVKNPDVADIVNTLQKMAQKRAYVAAVLLAVNGSEYFTQDMEDFIDVEIVDVAPSRTAPEPQPEPVQSQAASQPTPRAEPKKAAPKRPFSPDELRENFAKAVASVEARGLLLGPDDFSVTKAAIKNLFESERDTERYLEFVTGIPYIEDMSESHIVALLRLLKPDKDGNVCDDAFTEATAVIEHIAYQPAQQPAQMSLETAEAITNSEGIRYGDLPTDKLSSMTIGIDKALKKTALTDKEREEYQLKLAAIATILKHRNGDK